MPLAALQRWNLIQALLWLVVLPALPFLVAELGARDGIFAVWGGLMLISYAALGLLLRAGRNLADKVTLLRFLALLTVCGMGWHVGSIGWGLFLGCATVLLSDLLDGYCARRFGGSEAGAVLDMEADQFATLGLAMLIDRCTDVGPWVLILPGYRYLYILLMRSQGVSAHDPKPIEGDNRRARVICAAVMTLMLLALWPNGAAWLSHGCAGLAVLLLAYSYGADVVFLLRSRRRQAATTADRA